MKIPIKLLLHFTLIACSFKVYLNLKIEESKDQILLKNNGNNSKQKELNINTINNIDQEIKETEKKIEDLKYNLFHDSKYDIGYYIKNKSIFSNENLQMVKNFIRLIEYEEQLSYVENSKLN